MSAGSALTDVNGRGLLSARPTAGRAGRLYFATDTSTTYRDNGSSWDAQTSSGLSDPTTTRGDILFRNNSGAVTRLALGAANTVLHGSSTDPSYSAVVEGDLGLTDITTGNVSTTKHGFAPKAPNDATKYLDGTGAYSTPAGGATILGQPGGSLLRSYTFDTTTESWTTDNGTLTSTGARLRLVGSSNSSALEPVGAANVADGEVQMDAYVVSGAGCGVIFRATDANNYYGAFFGLINDGGDQGIVLYKRVSGSFTSLFSGTGILIGKLVSGTLHFKVLVRFVGSQLDVYFNEAHKLSLTDTTYSTGRVGIRAASGTTMEADNVKVYSVP